jgi:hypothetical protein
MDACNEFQQAGAIQWLPASPSATFYQPYDARSGKDRNKTIALCLADCRLH